MTLISKRSWALLAILMSMVMALTIWGGVRPGTVYAEDAEAELDSIDLKGASGDLGGTQFFILGNAEATLKQEDLGIEVKDNEGEPIDSEKYDLNLQAVWWDDAAEDDLYEDADLNGFGLTGDEASAGCTEYKLTATAKEDSGYSGEASIRFYLVDKYSLNYICADTDFPGYARKTGWRMHDWFTFWKGTEISPSVIPECGTGQKLGSDDFSVTYYPRSNTGDDMSSPEYGFEHWLDTSVGPLTGAPDEPGEYFAVIEGKGSYYGGNTVLIDVKDPGEIIFTTDGDEFLWSDEDKEYEVKVPAGVSGDVEILVGIRNEDGWEILLNNEDDSGQYFEFADGKLTLYGQKIVEKIRDDRWLDIHAVIKDSEDEILAEGYEGVQFRKAEAEYRFPEDENLLPGWEREIDDDDIEVWVRNRDHWDGDDIILPIKNVEITEQKPEGVIELYEEDGMWRYRGKAFGNATIQVTYEDIDESEKTCEFNVNVSDTVYEVYMWSEEGVYVGLPGDSINLCTYAAKRVKSNNGEEDPIYWEEGETSEGLTYQWEITEGEEYATISPEEDTAVLTFKDLPEGWDRIDERVRVKVTVFDTNSEEPKEARAEEENEFWVDDSFDLIYPTQIDPDLDVGKSLTIKPEVRHFEMGQDGYSIVDDVSYEIDCYSEDVIDVEGQDNVFTITRKKSWDTDFCIRARWNADGDREYEQWYHLNNKNYRISFGFRDADVYDDCNVTLDPWIEEGENLDPDDYEIRYTVGRAEYNEETDETTWPKVYGDDSGLYEIDGDKLTIFGSEMAKTGPDGLDVKAELYIGEEDFGDEWCWINLRESCTARGEEHKWITGVFKEPTLDEVGYEVQICPDYMFLDGCGEHRITEIPKLIDIADATVTVMNPAYTGKALEPALTVKVGDVTLKAGTDYTAEYTNNTKVGTASVTLSGKGKYGGTKTAEFNIVKAANPMVIKTKAVSLKVNNVKKKNQTIKPATAFTVTKNQGKVTYKKKSGNSKITIAENGTITVKKGLKKGSYKLVVNATAIGNANYNAVTKPATVTITVK